MGVGVGGGGGGEGVAGVGGMMAAEEGVAVVAAGGKPECWGVCHQASYSKCAGLRCTEGWLPDKQSERH